MDSTNQTLNENRELAKTDLDNCKQKLEIKIDAQFNKIALNKAELDEAKITVKNADKNTK